MTGSFTNRDAFIVDRVTGLILGGRGQDTGVTCTCTLSVACFSHILNNHVGSRVVQQVGRRLRESR